MEYYQMNDPFKLASSKYIPKTNNVIFNQQPPIRAGNVMVPQPIKHPQTKDLCITQYPIFDTKESPASSNDNVHAAEHRSVWSGTITSRKIPIPEIMDESSAQGNQ